MNRRIVTTGIWWVLIGLAVSALSLGVMATRTLGSLHVVDLFPWHQRVQPMALIGPPAIVQLSPTEFRLSRPGMLLRLKQDYVQVVKTMETGMVPVYAGEQIVGLRMVSMERLTLFKELGLRDGDIVRAVNGEPLQSIWEMNLRFRFVPRADVTVEREGRPLTLHYWVS